MRDAASLSRRVVLRGAALAIGGAAAGLAAGAAAQEKISQAEAKYQTHPNGQQRCEICLQFLPPGQCQIVQGPINPKGWCQFFAARENAR